MPDYSEPTMITKPIYEMMPRGTGERIADLTRLGQAVTRCWDELAHCEDEFAPDTQGACGELADKLDTSILALMRVADPERWEAREREMREARNANGGLVP